MTPHDLLDTEELAALLGVRPSSLSTMRAQPSRHRSIDGLPAPLRLVSGRPVWVRAKVVAWMASRPSEGTAPHRAKPPAEKPVESPVEPVVKAAVPVELEPVTPAADEVPWVPWPAEASRPV